MIDQQELEHRLAGFLRCLAVHMHYLPVSDSGGARNLQLGSLFHLHQTHPTHARYR